MSNIGNKDYRAIHALRDSFKVLESKVCKINIGPMNNVRERLVLSLRLKESGFPNIEACDKCDVVDDAICDNCEDGYSEDCEYIYLDDEKSILEQMDEIIRCLD